MREIKFRAWDKNNKKMYCVKKLHCNFINDDYGMHQLKNDEFVSVNDVELMQYTGLKDKNGKEIYEGDIVKLDTSEFKSDKYKHKFNSKVEYKYGMFCISENDKKPVYNIYDVRYHIEIIGNIYEDKELLQE